MRIGIDARPLAPPMTGIGNYLLQILKILERTDRANEYYLYCPNEFFCPFTSPNWHPRIANASFYNGGSVWLMGKASRQIRADAIDVFWAPHPILPFHLPIKMVLTIHDLVWTKYPQTMATLNSWVYRFFAFRSIMRADAIFVVSQSTINDLKHYDPTPIDKVHLTHNGIREDFVPLDKSRSQKFIQKKFSFNTSYLLSVGTLEPRKNLPIALRAFQELKLKYRIPHKLLIAGAKGWKNSHIYAEVRTLKLTDAVLFAGYIADEEMNQLYSGADALLFPSRYEGFGFPVLEAMACGCPVVASDIPVINEVAGKSALLVSPDDHAGMARAVFTLLTDPNLAEEKVKSGIARAKLFPWEKTAVKILEILNRLGEQDTQPHA